MKVLLISTAIEGGGAGNACLRLYLALRQKGADVRLLVLKRPKLLDEVLEQDDRVAFLEDKCLCKAQAKFAFVMERLEVLWHNRFNRQKLWQYSTASFGLDLSTHTWVQWADVLHLQWVNHGTLSLQSLKRIQKLNKVLVWTLHDLWALTGFAHLPSLLKEEERLFSSKYASRCLLRLNEDGRQGLVYERKGAIDNTHINYIAVSSFVSSMAEQLLGGRQGGSLEVIAPALDIQDCQSNKSNHSLFSWYEPSEHYLLVSAARLDNPIKGGNLLIEFAQKLKDLYPNQAKNITLLLLGTIKNVETFKDLKVKHIALGHIVDKAKIKELYRLADVTLSTSLFETFGLTLVESLAVGTPVLSFDCGGARDIIQDGINGYIVRDYNCERMVKQLLVLLEEVESKKITAQACQSSVLKFRAETIAQKHITYYQRLLACNE